VAKLPDESQARASLLQSITEQIEHLRNYDREASRDIPMLVFALLAAPGLGYLTLYPIQRDQWWTWALGIITGVFALVFVYGIFETCQGAP
jgi:fatty acid desaturase